MRWFGTPCIQSNVLFVATPLILGLIISNLLIFVLGSRALDEERLLSQDLAGYSAYCSQVKYRLVPFSDVKQLFVNN